MRRKFAVGPDYRNPKFGLGHNFRKVRLRPQDGMPFGWRREALLDGRASSTAVFAVLGALV